MTEETGLWTWRKRSEGRGLLEVTEAHLERIRGLTVIWDAGEAGAAVLADDEFSDLDNLDQEDEELATVLGIFMVSARVPAFEGLVRNPYARAGEDDRFGLDDVPASDIAKLLLSGQDIALKAEPDEVALWDNADRRFYGINPKRPFGSENVSRDVRALVDPEKTLSNAAFAKRRKWLESRLLLLLQFFVQNAVLPLGKWVRDDERNWRLLDPNETPPAGEEISRKEWASRMFLQNYYENRDYTDTLHALFHLARTDRLSGSHADIVKRFKLDNHFDAVSDFAYQGAIEERFLAALKFFPERLKDPGVPWFTLSYARVLNASARFEEAHAVLEAAGVFDITREELNSSTINTVLIAWVEGLIARYGSGRLPGRELFAILNGGHSKWYVQPTLISIFQQWRSYPKEYRDDAEEPGLDHARAMAAQLELIQTIDNRDVKLTAHGRVRGPD
ncbi:hypothetical protein GAO09_13845 [Rhizobiales bacterium RZME27]|uniref:Uncharacterized protein n=1 Tax=Endobacterium cereale TaxID=2663029 RepID=A0A6A8AB32_9HYPH|nr:hypothetical protein [Endobacterium cereale]MQY47117.1 hypothetical protein [Endobacterium cereale]